MRCSAVAAAAVVFFGVALAVPQKVVTQTEVVTITSCAPDVPDCPGRTSTSTYVTLEPTAETTTTPCPGVETSVSTPVVFPNTTAIVCPGHPDCPVETSVPVCPGGPDCPTYVPTGTGSPSAPANTSTPVVPTAPPQHTGAAVRTGASLVAVLGAAALAILA